jgi:uncharacterized protein YbjT (DUF2867 family)
MTRTILVAGATGTQGGGVVDALTSGEYGEFAVRGLTRRPDSPAAAALRECGVSVVAGDMTDRAAMDRAVAGADGVFGVTAAGAGDEERLQGTTLAEAAAAAGVDQFVFASGGNADRRPGIPHVDAKHDVERRLAALGMATTVIRPHSFMQNFERQREQIGNGRLAVPLPEGAEHVLVDARDVGRFAARAFADPDRFAGVTVELAAESLALPAIAAVFADVLGRPVKAVHVPTDAAGGMGAFMTFLADAEADPDRLRREFDFHPTDLRTYLLETGWAE